MGKFGGGGRFFFFFYDITKIRSFNYINVYLKQLKNYLFICDKEEKIPNFCIIGNKYDLENEKKIGNDIINKIVKNYGINFFDGHFLSCVRLWHCDVLHLFPLRKALEKGD